MQGAQCHAEKACHVGLGQRDLRAKSGYDRSIEMTQTDGVATRRAPMARTSASALGLGEDTISPRKWGNEQSADSCGATAPRVRTMPETCGRSPCNRVPPVCESKAMKEI